MMSRFHGRRIRITTGEGSVFSGIAEVFPSGYDLREAGCAEECIRLDDKIFSKSDIRSVEDLSGSVSGCNHPYYNEDMISNLLAGPYRIVDILPEQVPADSGGQYYEVERYFLRTERIRSLRLKYSEILLRLNCYYNMAVSFDSGSSWEMNPDPEEFSVKVAGLSGNCFLRVLFADRNAMIDLQPDDTYMTVYDPDSALNEKLNRLASADGCFVWSPPDGQS